MRTGWARALVDRLTRTGKVVKTTSLGGFALLYLLGEASAAAPPLAALRRRAGRA